MVENSQTYNLNEILCDTEMYPYFMSYIKRWILKKRLVENLPVSASEAEISHNLITTWNYTKSIDNLLKMLTEKYHIPEDLQQEESRMNEVIIHVCGELFEQLPEDDFLSYDDAEMLKVKRETSSDLGTSV